MDNGMPQDMDNVGKVLAAVPGAIIDLANACHDGSPEISDPAKVLENLVFTCGLGAVNGEIRNIWAFLGEYSQAALDTLPTR